MVLFHQVLLVFLILNGHGKCSPIPHYKPTNYFGPLGGLYQNIGSIEDIPINLINSYPGNYGPYYGGPIPRVARHSDPRLYYPEPEDLLFQSPEFQDLMPYYEDYSAPQEFHFSPELQRLMSSFQMLKEYLNNPNMRPSSSDPQENNFSPELQRLVASYKMLQEYLASPYVRPRRLSFPIKNNDDVNDAVSGRLLEVNGNDGARGLDSEHYSAVDNEKNVSEQDENIEDYYDDNENEGNEEEPVQSDRRTFGLIAPVIESGLNALDRGLGFTSSTSMDVTRTRETEATLNSLREAREQASLEALRTQQTLENLRNEAMQDSLKRKTEIDVLRHQVDIIKEQKDQERKEKEEIRAKLERETYQRERDRDELKRKYEYEVTIRDREANELQRKLQREEQERQHEREELKRKMEMETTLHEINSKKNLMEMKSSYDTYLATQNFKTVDDYRLPAVLGSSYYVPSFSATGTVGLMS